MEPHHNAKMAIARKLWRDMKDPVWPDPAKWLYNQENMRMIHIVICTGLAEGKRRPDITPEVVMYFEYMYTQFPTGYWDVLLDTYHKTHPTATPP